MTIKQIKSKVLKLYNAREAIHKKLLSVDLDLDELIKELLNKLEIK